MRQRRRSRTAPRSFCKGNSQTRAPDRDERPVEVHQESRVSATALFARADARLLRCGSRGQRGWRPVSLGLGRFTVRRWGVAGGGERSALERRAAGHRGCPEPMAPRAENAAVDGRDASAAGGGAACKRHDRARRVFRSSRRHSRCRRTLARGCSWTNHTSRRRIRSSWSRAAPAAVIRLGYAESLFVRSVEGRRQGEPQRSRGQEVRRVLRHVHQRWRCQSPVSPALVAHLPLHRSRKSRRRPSRSRWRTFAASTRAIPFEMKARFEGSDLRQGSGGQADRLSKILEVGWRTARLCAHETYMDCPYYEQLQYAGDTRIQALVSLLQRRRRPARRGTRLHN